MILNKGKKKGNFNFIFNNNSTKINGNTIFCTQMSSCRSKSTLTRTTKHQYHLVDPSPWPLVASIGAFTTTMGTVMYLHDYNSGFFGLLCGMTCIIYVMFMWWRDIIREATFEGKHTFAVQKGLKNGMILFITSEVMFFFAFFWAFFHSSLAPVPEIGCVWPPAAIQTLSAWEIPYLNTMILLLSGCTITVCHYSIIANDRKKAILSLIATIVLAIIFTLLQIYEYIHASFTMSDGIYGSVFYMATGFHGFHVFIGTCFLTVCLYRLYKHHFTQKHHLGFEAAAWYWHFVDVVWLFLFVSIYWWGGN